MFNLRIPFSKLGEENVQRPIVIDVLAGQEKALHLAVLLWNEFNDGRRGTFCKKFDNLANGPVRSDTEVVDDGQAKNKVALSTLTEGHPLSAKDSAGYRWIAEVLYDWIDIRQVA